MDFQIRDAINANMAQNSEEEIKHVVEDAMKRGEEHLLPGLGVFFEKVWSRSNDNEKSALVQKLSDAFG